MTAYNTFVYLVGEDKDDCVLERIKMTVIIPFVYHLLERIKMTAYNTFGEVDLVTLLERIKMTAYNTYWFTVLERIKMTVTYNTFVYLVGEDKDD